MTRILVVEDEVSFSDPLSYLLNKEGYDVVVAETGPDAITAFDADGADLVLLDLMLPGLSGIDVCRAIRQRSNVPVIMLTAKDGEIDKVVGLEIGADDYVTKPYSSRELLARIKAVLRRNSEPEELLPATIEGGPVRMDIDRHVVSVAGTQISLPLKEFELLEMLLRNVGRVLTRVQLIDRVWGSDYVGDTKTLDVHIKRLRAKIEPDPAKPVHIVTVRGPGNTSLRCPRPPPPARGAHARARPPAGVPASRRRRGSGSVAFFRALRGAGRRGGGPALGGVVLVVAGRVEDRGEHRGGLGAVADLDRDHVARGDRDLGEGHQTVITEADGGVGRDLGLRLAATRERDREGQLLAADVLDGADDGGVAPLLAADQGEVAHLGGVEVDGDAVAEGGGLGRLERGGDRAASRAGRQGRGQSDDRGAGEEVALHGAQPSRSPGPLRPGCAHVLPARTRRGILARRATVRRTTRRGNLEVAKGEISTWFSRSARRSCTPTMGLL